MSALLIRWRLWALVALAFALGILGIRAKWIGDGQAKLEAKQLKQRVKATAAAQETRNEIEALDRDTLKRRASVWVRKDNR